MRKPPLGYDSICLKFAIKVLCPLGIVLPVQWTSMEHPLDIPLWLTKLVPLFCPVHLSNGRPLQILPSLTRLVPLAKLLMNQIILMYHWWVCNSDIVDAGMPLTQHCPAPLIDSTTGCYSSTCTHSTRIWLASLISVQLKKALECAFVALNGSSIHSHTYQRYSGSLPSRYVHLFTQDTL